MSNPTISKARRSRKAKVTSSAVRSSTKLRVRVNKHLQKFRPGVSLADIARATGINVAYLSRVFNRKQKPSVRVLGQIADYLHVGLDDMRKVLAL